MKNSQFLGLTSNPAFKNQFNFESIRVFYEGFIDGRIEGSDKAKSLPTSSNRFTRYCSPKEIFDILEINKKYLNMSQIKELAYKNCLEKNIGERVRRKYAFGYINAYRISACFTYNQYDSEYFYEGYYIGYAKGCIKSKKRLFELNVRKVFKKVAMEAEELAYDDVGVEYCFKESRYSIQQTTAFIAGMKLGFFDGAIKCYYTYYNSENYIEWLAQKYIV